MLKTQVKKMYDALIVIRPNINDDGLDNSINQIESSIKNYGGSIVQMEEPSRKKFAHKIKGFKEGFYISVLFNSPPEVPNMLKRTFSISDDVLRYVIVKKESKKESKKENKKESKK